MNLTADLPQQQIKRQRAKAALVNLFVADSLAMPVHWFYNPGDILRVFGKHGITKLEAAPEVHPSSIMSLHSTSAGGRSRGKNPASKEVIGDVILKGRRHLWGRPGGHYHHGLQAGDNTLNAWCARLLVTHMSESLAYDSKDWIDAYIQFMTANPPAYPDTYAESYHRGFFANWIAGVPPLECGAVTHDTPSMGALVSVAPLALAMLGKGHTVDQVCQLCRTHVWLTHPDKLLADVVDAYVILVNELLCRSNEEALDSSCFVQAASVIKGTRLNKLLEGNKPDSHVVGRTYSLACYITDSWPSVCYLAARYANEVDRALLINTNLGGENAHRGSVLGTLVGLATGQYPEQWYSQLSLHEPLDEELERFLNSFYPKALLH